MIERRGTNTGRGDRGGDGALREDRTLGVDDFPVSGEAEGNPTEVAVFGFAKSTAESLIDAELDEEDRQVIAVPRENLAKAIASAMTLQFSHGLTEQKDWDKFQRTVTERIDAIVKLIRKVAKLMKVPAWMGDGLQLASETGPVLRNTCRMQEHVRTAAAGVFPPLLRMIIFNPDHAEERLGRILDCTGLPFMFDGRRSRVFRAPLGGGVTTYSHDKTP